MVDAATLAYESDDVARSPVEEAFPYPLEVDHE